MRQLVTFTILAYMKTLENFLKFATCIMCIILSFFQTSLKKEKKSQVSRIICVIQNHNLETEKDQKSISNFGLSSKELLKSCCFSFFLYLSFVVFVVVSPGFYFLRCHPTKKGKNLRIKECK